MKTFIADIIPSIQKYSQKLDNLTLLTNQHWVVVDEIANSKTVYIFRSNNELLISKNGEVEKAKWDYLGNNALLLDLKDKSYLFRHGFFDENVLALKVDGRDEYALMVNESKWEKELNSQVRILEFLDRKYIASQVKNRIIDGLQPEIDSNPKKSPIQSPDLKIVEKFKTNKGEIEVEHLPEYYPNVGDKASLNGKPAPNGKYKFDFLIFIHIKDGIIVKTTAF